MVDREMLRSSLPVLLSGLMLVACGGTSDPLAPSEEVLGTQESAQCAGSSVSALSIQGVSSYDGEVAGSGNWTVTYPANAVHLDFYVDGVLRATQELKSDTRSGTWNFSYSGVGGCSHTFQVRAYPMTIDSSNQVTRCPTSGTLSSSRSFTEPFCKKTYSIPTRLNQYGYGQEIWLSTENGRQFCGELGLGPMVGYQIGCGEDESSFVTFSNARWISQNSGSANQCYNIFASITCETASASFPWPTRANQYGYQQNLWQSTTNGNRFCQERGYSMMTNYSLGCGADEDSFVTFDGIRWISQNSGSTNQCYNIFASISCK